MTDTAQRSTAQRSPLTAGQRAQLRRRLEDERDGTRETVDQLSRDIHSVQASRQDTPTDDEHDPEGPTLAFEQSQSSALLWQARNRLARVDAALDRSSDPTIGVCSACAQPIGFDRLMARPYSEHCIRCAERAGA